MNKETIELVKKMVEDGNLPQEIAENYCPEIKEIDDDRIRKAITAGVTKLFEEYSVFGHTTKEEVLAWVAKQEHIRWTKYDKQMYGELKIFIQCYQRDKKVKEEMLEWIKTFRPQLNKSTETKWTEEDKPYFKKISLILSKELPADEFHDVMTWFEHLKSTDEEPDILKGATLDNNEDGLIADTIKAKSEQKIEWSVEDYNEIETIACHLDNIGNEGMAKVLLNIRDKYMFLIPHWKPSDEQMETLQYLCETSAHPNEKVIPTLESLYQDLKKLKG